MEWTHLCVLLLLVSPALAQQQLSRSASLGLAFGIIIAVIAGFVVLGLLLWRYNRSPTKKSNTHPHIVLRFIKFFFQYLFFELLSIPFAVAGILAIQGWPAGARGDVGPISVAYFVFFALKLCLFLFIVLFETIGLYHLGPLDQEEAILHRYQKVGRKLKLPPTWITIVEGGIFIPMLCIEGMLNNGEFTDSGGDVADFFPYDVVVLVVIDAILYIKLNLTYVLDIFAPKPFDITNVIYAMINVVVTLTFTFLFICYHLLLYPSIGFDLAAEPLVIVMLIIALVHNTLASFTSMLLQGIVFRCRALVGSELRIKLVNLYLRWFSNQPLMIVLNLLSYATCFGLYVICYVIAVKLLTFNTPDPGISALVLVVAILSLVVTTWLLLNLIYGVLKRLGSYLERYFRCAHNPLPCTMRCHCSWFPQIAFNCSSYSKEMNKILQECNAGWSFNLNMRR